MCLVEATYFIKDGSPLLGATCQAGQSDKIGVEALVWIPDTDSGKKFSAWVRIQKPDGVQVDIATPERQVSPGMETFTFGNWRTPIPLGNWKIINTQIVDQFGNVPCEGNVYGDACPNLTISAAAPVCNFEVT